jgi:cytochrome d ubiquinol oxidase subunit I
VIARTQPVKLAAMEGQFRTERGAPLRIGGWPDVAAGVTRHAIEIPKLLSLLAFEDPDATVRGLLDFPREDWPPVTPVHASFQLMVALGSAMALVSLWGCWAVLRKHDLLARRGLLRALVVVAPFGVIATEAGWTVTEVGRQPWIAQGLLRTSDAVSPMPGLTAPLIAFTLLYLGLGLIVVTVIRSMVRETAA